MNESHFLRNSVLVVAGVFVVGYIAVWLIHALFSIFFYLLVGGLAIGAGVWVYNRGKRAIREGKVPRRLGR